MPCRVVDQTHFSFRIARVPVPTLLKLHAPRKTNWSSFLEHQEASAWSKAKHSSWFRRSWPSLLERSRSAGGSKSPERKAARTWARATCSRARVCRPSSVERSVEGEGSSNTTSQRPQGSTQSFPQLYLQMHEAGSWRCDAILGPPDDESWSCTSAAILLPPLERFPPPPVTAEGFGFVRSLNEQSSSQRCKRKPIVRQFYASSWPFITFLSKRNNHGTGFGLLAIISRG